jgi:hypothetical protein
VAGDTERTLAASPDGCPTSHQYHITVVTSDKAGAGSDANVTVVLHGLLGDSGRRLLSMTERDFERGSTQTFVVKAGGVGELTGVTIGHDNFGFRPSWHLDQVRSPRVARMDVSLKSIPDWHIEKSSILSFWGR